MISIVKTLATEASGVTTAFNPVAGNAEPGKSVSIALSMFSQASWCGVVGDLCGFERSELQLEAGGRGAQIESKRGIGFFFERDSRRAARESAGTLPVETTFCAMKPAVVSKEPVPDVRTPSLKW